MTTSTVSSKLTDDRGRSKAPAQPSFRSQSQSRSGLHLRKESAETVGTSSIAPSMAEFGGRVERAVDGFDSMVVASGYVGGRNGRGADGTVNDAENEVGSLRARERARAKLRIDIPPRYAHEIANAQSNAHGHGEKMQQYRAGDDKKNAATEREDYKRKKSRRETSVTSFASTTTGTVVSSVPSSHPSLPTDNRPPEHGRDTTTTSVDTEERTTRELEREFGTMGREMGLAAEELRSPTGSVFSIASAQSSGARKSVSSAQSLKQRVRGMLTMNAYDVRPTSVSPSGSESGKRDGGVSVCFPHFFFRLSALYILCCADCILGAECVMFRKHDASRSSLFRGLLVDRT